MGKSAPHVSWQKLSAPVVIQATDNVPLAAPGYFAWILAIVGTSLIFSVSVIVNKIALLQVRCYLGDNEQRWYMWYSGNNSPGRAVDPISPCSGSTGW